MDKVVHFEIPVDDVERARGFYGTVFDWSIVPMDEADYTLVLTTPVDERVRWRTARRLSPAPSTGG
jgi:predicted enzyme related to lactoylglutathione lyase